MDRKAENYAQEFHIPASTKGKREFRGKLSPCFSLKSMSNSEKAKRNPAIGFQTLGFPRRLASMWMRRIREQTRKAIAKPISRRSGAHAMHTRHADD
jgi:hypothetical protein